MLPKGLIRPFESPVLKRLESVVQFKFLLNDHSKEILGIRAVWSFKSCNFRFYANRLSRIQLTITLKAKVPVIFLLTNLFVSIVSAGEVDARFDGKWIGVEIFPLTTAPYNWVLKVPQVTTVIGIAQSGKMLGVLSGFVPGRYSISPKSGGNILIFSGGNGIEGRNDCRLELSADGDTIKEIGSVAMFLHEGVRVTTQVYATFHRVSE
jgi:hypothetical protein